MKTFLLPLNVEEEKYYLEKMKEGSLEAKNTLIERNLRLVAHISRKYQNGEEKKVFSIDTPPPTVSGKLHIGHVFSYTQAEMIARFKRMQGYSALWMPGTDHAGIATQIKVEENLRVNEGLTRYDLGRDKFLERVWEWKERYGSRIIEQLKKLGSSCDWRRERFTMDEGCSKAVREVFVNLYEKGLIYKGNRIINWCPHCRTSISDAEVDEEIGKMAEQYSMEVDKVRAVVNPDDVRHDLLVRKALELVKDSVKKPAKKAAKKADKAEESAEEAETTEE